MQMCTECGRTYKYDRTKGHRKYVCNSCTTNHRRTVLKRRYVKQLGGVCSSCGYVGCLAALEFHHEGSEKEFTISGNYYLPQETVQGELDKTVLLCANCHREVHSSPSVRL